MKVLFYKLLLFGWERHYSTYYFSLCCIVHFAHLRQKQCSYIYRYTNGNLKILLRFLYTILYVPVHSYNLNIGSFKDSSRGKLPCDPFLQYHYHKTAQRLFWIGLGKYKIVLSHTAYNNKHPIFAVCELTILIYLYNLYS